MIYAIRPRRNWTQLALDRSQQLVCLAHLTALDDAVYAARVANVVERFPGNDDEVSQLAHFDRAEVI